MKRQIIETLASYSVERLAEWLTDGVERMNGLREPIDSAFEPAEHIVGQSRRYSYLEDLELEIFHEFDGQANLKFLSAIDLALAEMAERLNARTWLPVDHLLKLTRRLKTPHPLEGITRLTEKLGEAELDLPPGAAEHIISTALLALVEVLGPDRKNAKQTALKLVQLLLIEKPGMSPPQRKIIAKKLRRIHVNDDELVDIGLLDVPAPGTDAEQKSVFRRINHLEEVVEQA